MQIILFQKEFENPKNPSIFKSYKHKDPFDEIVGRGVFYIKKLNFYFFTFTDGFHGMVYHKDLLALILFSFMQQ